MKRAILILLFSTLFLGGSSFVLAVSCTPITSLYPTSLDTFAANDCIPSGWANQLEKTIGVTNSTVTSSITYTANLANTVISTATPFFYINGGRTDSYTANGSFAYPFKSLSSAIASSTGYAGYVYNLTPGTYVDGAPDTFTTSPFAIQGNESTYVAPSGVTFPGSFDIYDLTIVGNVTESDNLLTFIHQFNNGVITGNLTLAGLATLSNMAFPTTSSIISALPGSLVNIVGTDMNNTVQSSGTVNIDDDALIGSSSLPLVNSTAGTVNMLGATLINTGSGGGIVINNGATSTPNNINSISIGVNSSSPGSTIKTGTSATVICNVTGLTNFFGTFIAPSGTNFPPCYDESRAVLNAFSVGTSTQLSSGTLLSGTVNLPNIPINSFLATDANHNIVATGTPASSTTTPGGNNNTVQFNNGGNFGGISEATYNTSTDQTKFTASSSPAYGNSISTGGVVNITGTNTTSSSFVVTSNQGVSQGGRMVVFNQQNPLDPQDAVLIQSNASGSTPLNVKSWATGKGGIKIEQETTSSDANASGLSIDVGAGGGGTAAQGMRIDATNGGTSGPGLTVLNNGKQEFQVISQSSSTATTTIKFGSANVATCLELEDSTGTTLWYLTITGGALQATTTKPTICL